jgi:Na+/H+ antiporter NhaD/arsenite permease-like protein
MDLAWISVIALVITILVSCFARLNPGVLAIAFAGLIALVLAPLFDQPMTVKVVVAGFPAELFLTLTGVTLLFGQAQVNGTLERVAHVAVRLCQGNAAMIPLAFFSLAAVISAIGAGSIATAALVAPMAMAAAGNARIPAFLMAVMVGHGAVAGGMSRFALTGIVMNGIMERMGFPGYEWHTFFHNFAANAFVALGAWLFFGAWRLLRRRADLEKNDRRIGDADGPKPAAFSAGPWEGKHQITLSVIAVLIVLVLVLNVHVGMAAFGGVALLTLVKAADEREMFRAAPWPVIVMVCGVAMLTALIERTGGVERMTGVIAAVATRRSLPGVLAFATGVISVYSSTSGVVLPALLPAAPSLVEKVGGSDPVALATAISIGGNLVDVSPLSTIGALCIASAAATEDRRILFHQLLAWGLSMSVVAALWCTLVFGFRADATAVSL